MSETGLLYLIGKQDFSIEQIKNFLLFTVIVGFVHVGLALIRFAVTDNINAFDLYAALGIMLLLLLFGEMKLSRLHGVPYFCAIIVALSLVTDVFLLTLGVSLFIVIAAASLIAVLDHDRKARKGAKA